MTQQIINVGAVANDGTGESLRSAFQAVNDNFSNVWAQGPVDSQVVISTNVISTNVSNRNLVLQANGIGVITVSSSVVPGIDSVWDLGAANAQYDSVYARYYYGDASNMTGLPQPTNLGAVNTDILPVATQAFNIGSQTRQWQKVYTGGIVAGNASVITINVGNLHIPGGTNGYVLQTDGAGNLSWTAQTGGGGGNGTPGGANTQIQFNDAGTFGGQADFTFNKTSNVMTVPGNIVPNANAAQSLGNVSHQWKDLWVSNNTIYINSVPLTLSAGNVLSIGGEPLVTVNANSVANIGDFVFNGNRLENTNGSSFDNGGLVNGATALLSLPANGNTGPVAVYNSYGNIVLQAGANADVTAQWNFNNNGTLSTQGNITANSVSLSGQLIFANGSGAVGEVGYGFSGPAINAYTGKSVTIRSNDQAYSWRFGTAGNLTLPDGSVIQSGVLYGNGSAALGNATGDNKVYAQDSGVGVQTNNGNITNTWFYDRNGNLTLPGNTFAVNYANGTQVSIGGGSANTGNVTFSNQIVIGTGDDYGGGGLYLAQGPNSVANLQYLRVRGGDYPTHIHFDTGNVQYYDQYFGDDNKYVKLEAGFAGNIVIGTDDDNDNLYRWTYDSTGNLTVPGNIQTINSGFSFTSNITGVDTTTTPGNVYIELADNVFGGPETGRVTITDVVGTTEANGTWYFEAAEVNYIQLFYDAALTSPVDGTGWPAYESGGLAVAAGYSDLGITGGNVSIVNNVGNTWTFGANGNLTVPGAINSTSTLVYRGFYASVNQISELSGDPSINQIVLSQSSSISGSNLTTDTNDDNFTVTGLGTSYNTAIINLYGADFNNPIPLEDIQTFVRTYIDTVLYNGATLRTSVADVQTAFAANEAALIASVPSGTLYNLNFNAIQTVFQTNAYPNTGEGTGAVFYFNFDDAPGGTFDYSTMGWNNNDVIVPGTGYAVNDVLTIPGTEFGGTSPANDMEITVTAITVDGGIDAYNIAGTMNQATYEQCFVKYFIYDGNDDAYDTGNYIGTNRSQCVFTATTNADGELVVSAVASGSLYPYQTFYTESNGFVMVLWQKDGATEGGTGTYIINSIDSNLTEATYTANGIYYAIDDIVAGSNTWNGADYGGMVSTTAGIFSIVALDGNVTTVNYLGETGADGDGSKTAYSQFVLGLADPMVLSSGSRTWNFDANGGTIFPTLTVTRGDRTGTLTGQTLLFGDSTQEAIITTPNGTSDIWNSQRFVINPGAGYANTTGEGGDIYLYAGRGGNAGGSGGDIKIRGGLGPVNGDGGYIDIIGGEADADGQGGRIDIQGGQSGNSTGGTVRIYGGQGITGGDANIIGGTSISGTGGVVNITGGTSGLGLADYGNVNISAGASTWTFDNIGKLRAGPLSISSQYGLGTTGTILEQDGTLELVGNGTGCVVVGWNSSYGTLDNVAQMYFNPAGNSGNIVITTGNRAATEYNWNFDSTGNLTLPGNILGSGNILITPDSANSGGYLDIYLTTGPDVHLTSNSDSNLILGRDSYANVALNLNGNVSIQASTGSGANVWTFGTDGVLNLPYEGILQSTDDTVTLRTFNTTTGNANSVYLGTSGGLGFFDQAIGANWLEIFRSGIDPQIATTGNLLIRADSTNTAPTWNFGANGNLTAPGSIVTASGSGGNISGANVITANTFVGSLSYLANSAGRLTLLSDNTLLSGTVASPQNFKVNDSYTPDIDLRNASGTGTFTQGATSYTIRVAGTNNLTLDNTGLLSAPGNVSAAGNVIGNYFVGNGSALTSVATQVTGSWTLTTGTNTVSFTIPTSGTYSIWVNGNIPNGIATYTATIVLTNTNVPVGGSSYAWYYAAGNALVWTSIPNQIVGTNNAISNAAPAVSNTNVFTFGIDNNSGSSQVVNYGWTKL